MSNASHEIHRRRHRRPGPHFRCELPRTYVEIRRGRAENLLRPVDNPVFLIGSATDCDLVLGDQQFPDVHFYLFQHGGGISLRQLGASPEITINGRLAESTILYDGDRLRTGPYEFYVRSRESLVARQVLK